MLDGKAIRSNAEKLRKITGVMAGIHLANLDDSGVVSVYTSVANASEDLEALGMRADVKDIQHKTAVAWAIMMGSFSGYSFGMGKKADEDNAPADAIYERDGAWRTLEGTNPHTAARVQRILAILES